MGVLYYLQFLSALIEAPEGSWETQSQRRRRMYVNMNVYVSDLHEGRSNGRHSLEGGKKRINLRTRAR